MAYLVLSRPYLGVGEAAAFLDLRETRIWPPHVPSKQLPNLNRSHLLLFLLLLNTPRAEIFTNTILGVPYYSYNYIL